jgi:WD40 repeat protein
MAYKRITQKINDENIYTHLLITGSGDREVKVWNIENGKCLLTLTQPTNEEQADWCKVEPKNGVNYRRSTNSKSAIRKRVSTISAIATCEYHHERNIGMYEKRFAIYAGNKYGVIYEHNMSMKDFLADPKDAILERISVSELSKSDKQNGKILRDDFHTLRISSLVVCDEIWDGTKTGRGQLLRCPLLIAASEDKFFTVFSIKGEKLYGKALYSPEKTPHFDVILGIAILEDQSKNKYNEGKEYDDIDKFSNLRIISVGWDKIIAKWAFHNKEKPIFVTKQTHSKKISCCLVHYPQGEEKASKFYCPIIITGSLDTNIIVWDGGDDNTMLKAKVLEGHSGEIQSLVVHDSDGDGKPCTLFSTALDRNAILWDISRGEIMRIVEYYENMLCSTLVYRDEKLQQFFFATGTAEGDVIFWNLNKTRKTIKLETGPVTSIVDAYGRDYFAIGDTIGVQSLFSRSSSINNKTEETYSAPSYHKARINATVYYKNRFLISADGDGWIICYDLTKLDSLPISVGKHAKGNAMAVEVCSYKTEMDVVISGGSDGNLYLWDLTFIEDFDKVPRPSTVDDYKGINTYKRAHTDMVRHIVVHQPSNEYPFEYTRIFTSSYDRACILWFLTKSQGQKQDFYYLLPIMVFDSGVHSDAVFFIGIYDEREHQQDSKKDLILVTSSRDKSIATWNVDLKSAETQLDALINNPILQGPLMEKQSRKWNEKLIIVDKIRAKVKNKDGKEVEIIKEFSSEAHSDWITAMAVHVPKDKRFNPLIVSGSIDRKVKVWDLKSGVCLRTLVGHTDRICYLTTITTSVNGVDRSFILSGSDDQTTRLWEDCLHSFNFMPFSETVTDAFNSDLSKKDDNWPLVTDLVKEYGAKLLIENSHLFMFAVENERPSFLLKFRRHLTIALPTIAKKKKGTEVMDILSYAIHKKSLRGTMAILLSWVELLNRDIDNILDQKIYHPSYSFPKKALNKLSSTFPQMFIAFISSLRLIRNYIHPGSNNIVETKGSVHFTEPRVIKEDSAIDFKSNKEIPYIQRNADGKYTDNF